MCICFRPSARFAFPRAGERIASACGTTADHDAAFYCPADDTIVIGHRIAERVVATTGDFGAAFIVAHEYAHNVQHELGFGRVLAAYLHRVNLGARGIPLPCAGVSPLTFLRHWLLRSH